MNSSNIVALYKIKSNISLTFLNNTQMYFNKQLYMYFGQNCIALVHNKIPVCACVCKQTRVCGQCNQITCLVC